MSNTKFKILMFGDIVGKPGRKIVISKIDELKQQHDINFVIANGENCAGGFGITQKIANNLYNNGINVITSGNHIWKNNDIYNFIDSEDRILKPLNFPEGTPGKGYNIYSAGDVRILVVNLLGRINLLETDCPFQKIDTLLKDIPQDNYDLSIVDFHSETTSEKIAMGWFLNGRISAVAGTHTHVQTADEKILDKGTAFISDIGMCGSFDSVLGVSKDRIIQHFLLRMPIRNKLALKDPGINSVIIKFDLQSKRAINIERYNYFEKDEKTS